MDAPDAAPLYLEFAARRPLPLAAGEVYDADLTTDPDPDASPPPMPVLTDAARGFCERARVARLATADARGVPHLVPVCFALIGDSLHISIDEKPKRTDIPLKRLRNIEENPNVAVTVDRWDEDWRRLAWVMLHGRAEILADGAEHDAAQARLRERYPQYRTMDLAPLPVIAVRIGRALAWGALEEPEETHAGT